MKTYSVTVTMLAMTLFASICSRTLTPCALAQEPPVVVPGTADESRQASGMTPQAERQAIADEQAKVPGDAIFRMSGQGVDGNVRITSTSVHIEDGQPVWYLGGFGKCGGAIPPPEQQAAIRAYFAKYTTAEVRFEKGRLISTTPVNIAKLKGCE